MLVASGLRNVREQVGNCRESDFANVENLERIPNRLLSFPRSRSVLCVHCAFCLVAVLVPTSPQPQPWSRELRAAGALAPLGKAQVMTGFPAGLASVGPVGQRVEAGGHTEPVEGVHGVGGGIYAQRGGKAGVAIKGYHG